jgi:hypothetical protein
MEKEGDYMIKMIEKMMPGCRGQSVGGDVSPSMREDHD